MQREFSKIMAPSRFPIELTKQESVVIDLQSARACYFWNASPIPLGPDSIPRFGRITKRPYTCLYRKYLLINDLKKEQLPSVRVGSVTCMSETYHHEGKNNEYIFLKRIMKSGY